jgi:hypothetical protein
VQRAVRLEVVGQLLQHAGGKALAQTRASGSLISILLSVSSPTHALVMWNIASPIGAVVSMQGSWRVHGPQPRPGEATPASG